MWQVFFAAFNKFLFCSFPSVKVLVPHTKKLSLCLFTSLSSLNVSLLGDDSSANIKSATAHPAAMDISLPCARLLLTSLVFQRWRSLGREEHLGRHSSSFFGRQIFNCPGSSGEVEGNQGKLESDKRCMAIGKSFEHKTLRALNTKVLAVSRIQS